jgi:hypothetical protein
VWGICEAFGSLGDLAGCRKVILDGIFQDSLSVSFKFSGVYSHVCIPKQGKVAAVCWIAESANHVKHQRRWCCLNVTGPNLLCQGRFLSALVDLVAGPPA